MRTCDRSGFFQKNFSCGVTSCTPEVGHLFMRYTVVFAASAKYHFGRFFSFINVGDKVVNSEDHTAILMVKNLRMRESKRDMHREREREGQRI